MAKSHFAVVALCASVSKFVSIELVSPGRIGTNTAVVALDVDGWKAQLNVKNAHMARVNRSWTRATIASPYRAKPIV